MEGFATEISSVSGRYSTADSQGSGFQVLCVLLDERDGPGNGFKDVAGGVRSLLGAESGESWSPEVIQPCSVVANDLPELVFLESRRTAIR